MLEEVVGRKVGFLPLTHLVVVGENTRRGMVRGKSLVKKMEIFFKKDFLRKYDSYRNIFIKYFMSNLALLNFIKIFI